MQDLNQPGLAVAAGLNAGGNMNLGPQMVKTGSMQEPEAGGMPTKISPFEAFHQLKLERQK